MNINSTLGKDQTMYSKRYAFFVLDLNEFKVLHDFIETGRCIP